MQQSERIPVWLEARDTDQMAALVNAPTGTARNLLHVDVEVGFVAIVRGIGNMCRIGRPGAKVVYHSRVVGERPRLRFAGIEHHQLLPLVAATVDPEDQPVVKW